MIGDIMLYLVLKKRSDLNNFAAVHKGRYPCLCSWWGGTNSQCLCSWWGGTKFPVLNSLLFIL